MASITLSGILKNSLGGIDVGAVIRFTHETTTGDVIKNTESTYIIPPDGLYNITLEYGQIRVDYTSEFTELFVGTVVVNGDTVATSIPELLNAAVPVTDPVILEMQDILADAQAAAVTSEAFADQLTTLDLIASAATFSADTSIRTKGYAASGDGGTASWKQNGVTGQTASQSPAQLVDGLLNDANGDQWGIVYESKGMDLRAFGLTFDAAIDAAIAGCAGVCDIVISDAFTTSGKAYTSISDVTLRFVEGGSLTLSAAADAHLLSFTTSTNINIYNANIDGSRSTQTVVSGGSAFNAINFESCVGARVAGGTITGAAGSAVRGRNTSDIKVTDVTITDSGYRQIYIAPATTSGVDSYAVVVEGCNVSWAGLADSSITGQPCISVTNNGVSLFDDVSVKNNIVAQHSDNVNDSICIEGGGSTNFNIEGNKCTGGKLGISWFDCVNFSVTGNVTKGQSGIGIECANRNINGTITGNSIYGNDILADGISVNGALGICENIVISGNPIDGVIDGIAMFGGSLASRHLNITCTSNNIRCIGGGKPYNVQWVDLLSIEGGILDGNSLSSAIIQLVECDQFTITGTTQKNIQTFCVNMSSTQAVTITNSYVGSNNFDSVPGSQQLNYVRNSLFAGSTISSLVVKGNSRGADFIDYGNNILSWSGTGTPEGTITAGISSDFRRTDGGAGTTFYYKESGTGSTGWVAK